MDLADIWQEHKKYILAVVGALVLLLVGEGVIGGQHDYQSKGQSARSLNSSMNKAIKVADREVRELDDHVDGLRERLQRNVDLMGFRADDLFVLPPGESNPGRFCRTRILEMQALRDEAEREDILIPDKLGLQDFAPTDTEEIRRTLRALNIIYHVVLGCIDARVDRVTRISIEPEARRRPGRAGSAGFLGATRVEFEIEGREDALRQVIASVVESGRDGSAPYLELSTPTEIERTKEDPDLLHLRLTVAGLSLATEDLGLEDS